MHQKKKKLWKTSLETVNVKSKKKKPPFSVNPFPNDKFWTLPNSKSLQMTISNLMKMAETSPNGLKTLWEKEKLLVTSNFSFSHSVFKRFVLQTRKNQGLFGKGLRDRDNRDIERGRENFIII